MNVFCRLFGHTWIPGTDAPSPRWNNNKDGHILEASVEDQEVRHFFECRRCGERKEDAPRRLDRDGLEQPSAPATE